MTSAASTAPTIPAVPAVTRKDRRLTVDVWAPTAHGSSDFRSDMVASACVVLACETAPGNHSDRLYAGIRWCSSVIRDDCLCVHAIALALGNALPVFVARKVLDSAGVSPDSLDDPERTPATKGRPGPI